MIRQAKIPAALFAALIGLYGHAFGGPEGSNNAGPVAVPFDYRVGAGDVLEISVWKEEDLSKEVLVRPDGGITFPLIGEVKAGGHTVDELTGEIVSRLADYVSEPAVNVAVKAVNQKVYVVGKVNKPGEFVTATRVNVMQALAMAGGLTPFADDDNIRIIRRVGDKEVAFPFDYDEVEHGKSLEQNIPLERGDTVVVP